MEIILTKHAVFRIEKRGILKDEVIHAVKNPGNTIKKHGKHYLQKKLDRGTIEICCEKTEKYIKIITIYWL